MEDIKIGNLVDGKFNHLNSTPPPEAKPPASVMTLEATVENKPQPLRTIRPYAQACLKVPDLLCDEAKIVLHALFSCFEKAGEIREGLCGDLMWGFSQIGISPTLTYTGLSALAKEGYVRFQAPDNEYVTIDSFAADKAWVRYQPRLLEMAYDA